MINRVEIIRELKRAMEFYRELGFEYLPLKTGDIQDFLNSQNLLLKQKEAISGGKLSQETESIEHKNGALGSLRKEMGDCKRCKLSRHRKNIVFGEGSPDAGIMFIGEGPGRDEDIQARPFVGDAGKLLTRLILKMGMKREEVYIANIVKCRPPHNRDPELDEIATCIQFLEKQIEIIRPRVIISLGRISAHSLLGAKTPITRLRGNFFVYNDIPVMPTFHPAYLLRNPKDKWLTWDDARKALDKLVK